MFISMALIGASTAMQEFSKRDVLKATGALGAASLAGCLGMGGDGDDNNAVTFWSSLFESEVHAEFTQWVKDRCEEETGREFELTEYSYSDLQQNVLTGGQTGTPDVIEGVIEHPGDYVAADMLEPMTDRTDEIDHFDGFIDSAVEAFRFKDELWALPYTGNGRALVYRKDVLAEYGYEDGPPEDAEEFMELAGTINADRDAMNGFHLTTERGEVRTTQEFLSHVYQHTDGPLFEEAGDGWEPQASADDFEAILDTFYYGLFHSDQPAASSGYQGAGWETNDVGYSEGEHAMIHCGPWIQENTDSEQQAEIIQEQTAISLLPKHQGTADATYMEVKPVMVNAHSNNKEEAFTATEIFSSPEGIKVMGDEQPGTTATPVHEDVEPTIEDEDYLTLTDAFENGVAPAPISWGSVRESIYVAIDNVIYEEQTPAQAAADLESALQEANVEPGGQA